jgi:hypothetical protein
VKLGQVEVHGSFVPRDERDADANVVLDVRSASRNAEAQYRYRFHVSLAGQDPLELCVRERHMYALVPRAGRSWKSLLASAEALESGLDVVRLDGAGEER